MFRWFKKLWDQSAMVETLERENTKLRGQLQASEKRRLVLEDSVKKIAEIARPSW